MGLFRGQFPNEAAHQNHQGHLQEIAPACKLPGVKLWNLIFYLGAVPHRFEGSYFPDQGLNPCLGSESTES